MRKGFAQVRPLYTIREMSAVMQLGLPGSVPVPTDDDKSPKRKSESGGRSGANKAGRATETRRGLEPPGLGRELGAEGAENRQLTISMVDFERLLDRQSATILQANREHAQGLLDALEARHGSRLDALEGGATKVQTGIAQMEERLAALERTVQNQLGHPGGAEAKRRHTLVFGGWDRDTRRGESAAGAPGSGHGLRAGQAGVGEGLHNGSQAISRHDELPSTGLRNR